MQYITKNINKNTVLFLTSFMIFTSIATLLMKIGYFDNINHNHITDCLLKDCRIINYNIYVNYTLNLDNNTYYKHTHFVTYNYDKCDILNGTIRCMYDDRDIQGSLTTFITDFTGTLALSIILYICALSCLIFLIFMLSCCQDLFYRVFRKENYIQI